MESGTGQEARLNHLLEQAKKLRDRNPAGYLAILTSVRLQNDFCDRSQNWETELLLVDALLLNGRIEDALRHCHKLKQAYLEGLYPTCSDLPLIQLCIRCHDAMGQYEQAMHYRLELFQRHDLTEPEMQLDNLLGIARYHNQNGNPNKALDFLLQAHELLTQHALPQSYYGLIRSQQAEAWLQLKSLPQALNAIENALTVWEDLGLLRERGEDLARLAAIQHASGESHQALEVLQQALLMLEAANCLHRMSAVHMQAARIHADLSQLDEALHHASAVLTLARESNLREMECKAHALLGELHERQGNYKLALKHLRAHYRLEQQIFSEQTHQKLLQLELDHALQKSEQEKTLYQIKTNQLAQALKEAEQLRIALEKQAHRDQLTQLYNRHYLVDKLNTTFRRSRRNDKPLTLVLADLDHFKKINDRYSHAVGDQVLIRVAEILRANLRKSDVAGRYGGEEFLLILPDTDEQAALRVCEKLRRAIHGHDWSRIAPGLQVTISMGICARPNARSHEELLQMADRFLYAAKAAGRNRVVAEMEEA